MITRVSHLRFNRPSVDIRQLTMLWLRTSVGLGSILVAVALAWSLPQPTSINTLALSMVLLLGAMGLWINYQFRALRQQITDLQAQLTQAQARRPYQPTTTTVRSDSDQVFNHFHTRH
jgi:hypothetical protein